MNRELLRKHCEKMCKMYESAPSSNAYMEHRFVLDLLEQTRWVPVSERLPETDDEVLVTDGIDMFVAWYSRQDMWQGWISSDNNFERNTPIEAWMPLPESYKKSEDKE